MKLIKKLNIISISNNELKVSVCKKQKYITRIVGRSAEVGKRLWILKWKRLWQ